MFKHKDYREIYIPAAAKIQYNESDLIEIEQVIPSWCLNIFKPIKRLNVMQSQVCSYALN